jgi:hypothetical protein
MLTTHTPPSSAEVKEDLSYTSTHPMDPSGPVTGFPQVALNMYERDRRENKLFFG